jgi:hypothetical protein
MEYKLYSVTTSGFVGYKLNKVLLQASLNTSYKVRENKCTKKPRQTPLPPQVDSLVLSLTVAHMTIRLLLILSLHSFSWDDGFFILMKVFLFVIVDGCISF